MFNLLANAMFEATRVSAPPVGPVRNRWFTNRAEGFLPLSGRRGEP